MLTSCNEIYLEDRFWAYEYICSIFKRFTNSPIKNYCNYRRALYHFIFLSRFRQASNIYLFHFHSTM